MDLTTSTVSSAGGQTQAARSGAALTANFDGFLKLLGAQLQNQDPLSPMDATQFTSQLVQFSTVEQAIRTNDQLGRLTDLIKGNTLTSALGFIGLEVGFDADQLRLGDQGAASIDYELPRAAAGVTITIRDQRGAIVHQAEGAPSGAGAHRVEWDGRGTGGARAPAGLYRVEVRATDEGGRPVEVRKVGRGRVDGIEAGADGLRLTVGGVPVPLSSVGAVSRPGTAAAAGAAAAT